MLKLENVYKTFFPGSPNEKKALQGVSFTLEDGDFATVIGSNGAGKSTVLNSIAGVFPIDSGRIIIGDTDVTKMPEHKRARFIGRVFQDPMKGRHTEIDMFSGALIRMGKELGIPTPYNEFTYHMIKALEEKNDRRFDYSGSEEPLWAK